VENVMELEALLARQKQAYLSDGLPSAELRIERLKRLESVLADHQRAWVEVLDEDFGGRPPLQTRMEIFGALESIRHARKHVRKWMRPERRALPWLMRLTGARAEVFYQPLGVVGVVSPWNFPLVLSIGALAGVFAAGNRAMLKPSELTSATSALLKRLLDETFADDPLALTTILGGPAVGAAFTALPFDHLLFTGAPSVAHHVMRAAAQNLVPVTLELGGKCPVIIGDEADWDLAVDRVMWGKIQNAGQICLAPDYVMVPHARVEEFVRRARERMQGWYAEARDNPDFCSIINERHCQRLRGYLDEARQRGTRLEAMLPEPQGSADRRITPTLFVEPDPKLGIMRDEVFGPLLSVLGYENLDQCIAFINARPRPLALYYFGSDRNALRQLTERTTSGGLTVNDIASHAAAENLPLGGVGNSGMGRYHGRDGFVNFSHAKAVMTQRRTSLARLFNPPYGGKQTRMLDRVIGVPMK
jgi:coniferyl-aldehyde dehydrogenase